MPKTSPKETVSIGEMVDRAKGHPAGFDYMRLVLALAVVVSHSCVTSYGRDADKALFENFPPVRLILPMFFALSGYLVAGSLERSRTLGMFLALRVIRIYPALIVEVFLSAFLLGLLVTTLPFNSYFHNAIFFSYLLNSLGDVHFFLPGVFERNPLPNIVNGQLWTVPCELFCYVVIFATALCGLLRYRILALLSTAAITIINFCISFYGLESAAEGFRGTVQGGSLVATFMAGVSVYFYRFAVPWKYSIGLIAPVVSLVALYSNGPYGDLFIPIPAAIATVALGVTNPSRKILRGADYSYGIFLYGFVIQQTIVHFFPFARVWYLNICLSIPASVLVAAASWHLVESKANKLKPLLRRFEERILQRKLSLRRMSAAVADLSPERGDVRVQRWPD